MAEGVKKMKKKTLLRTGAVGSVVAALCCFTPLLVWPLTAVGLAAATRYLDYVLLPALAFFLALTAYAVLIKKDDEKDAP